LHTILSYPCFLWDAPRVAARLRITQKSFDQSFQQAPAFRAILDAARYNGILSDFAGPRWWRHRIEKFAWDLTKGDSQNPEVLRSNLGSLMGQMPDPSQKDQPLVCLDRDYRPLTETCSFQSAVRVQPDDWPAFADSAWMSLDLVRENPDLRMLVIEEDQSRLPDAGK
jgi:hypothetical protein